MHKSANSSFLQAHEDPDLFREAISFTAAQSHFLPRLIEKDYFCSLLLNYLERCDSSLVFKGGTCLAKVHAEFHRLSEDIDFTIPASRAVSRSDRRRLSVALKDAVAHLPRELITFRLIKPLTGANNSTQYTATVGYTSLITRSEETVRIEVGMREPLMHKVWNGMARTILLDPVSARPMLPPIPVRCLSRNEAMAEKLRAALSRRDAAIRDFYDIDYAVRRMDFQFLDAAFVRLVKQKITMAGTDPVDTSPDRLASLWRQLETQLKPVLRVHDFAQFNLERAFRVVADVAALL
ncbi:MAG TPA: nucleotidyl transferase AbiEii/AbiGii toxin family protein [Thermodesulfobacteriota bacterium]|nr:nucleotidyl transferase AbiEii/AbiGii toxin family protein [Thermodesulfobacteriota bacterium]